MTPATFSAVSALSDHPDGGFGAEIHPEWTIAGRPNGGYLLAVLGRAATLAGQHPDVIAASAHYLHSPEPGPVRVVAEVLRAGRSVSQIRTRMSQDRHVCVEALVTTGALDAAAKPYWTGGVPDPAVTPPSTGVRVPGVNPTGVAVPIMDEVDLRLDRDSAGFSTGSPTGQGELRGWLTLPAAESFTSVSLLYAVDAFPPATFDLELTGWVPTLELTAYVRAVPAPGPVRVLQRAHLIDGQRVDQDCWVWDTAGRVVAHSTQLAGIRLG